MSQSQPHQLNMVFWNCGGLYPHLRESHLEQYLRTEHSPPLLMALAETHWRAMGSNGPNPKPLPSYLWSCHHPPPTTSARTGGGLALLYHKKVAVHAHHDLRIALPHRSRIGVTTNSATLWHTIRLPSSRPFLLGIIYLTPQDNTTAINVQLVTANIDNARAAHPTLPMIVVGDFNLKHPEWRDPLACDNRYSPQPAANHLADYIDTTGLTILNNVYTPGMVTHPAAGANQGSIIDLILTDSPTMFINMHMTSSDKLDSDHLPITLTFTPPGRPPDHTTPSSLDADGTTMPMSKPGR